MDKIDRLNVISRFCTDGKISLTIILPLFSTVVPSNICMFLSCRPFFVITTFSTGLVGLEVTSVSCPSLQAYRIETYIY